MVVARILERQAEMKRRVWPRIRWPRRTYIERLSYLRADQLDRHKALFKEHQERLHGIRGGASDEGLRSLLNAETVRFHDERARLFALFVEGSEQVKKPRVPIPRVELPASEQGRVDEPDLVCGSVGVVLVGLLVLLAFLVGLVLWVVVVSQQG